VPNSKENCKRSRVVANNVLCSMLGLTQKRIVRRSGGKSPRENGA